MDSLVTEHISQPTATEHEPITAPPATTSTSKPAPKPARLLSLDAYRGLIMIVLATSGLRFSTVYHNSFPDSPIWRFLAFHTDHVPWIGCSFWDLIQPAFMFMVGVAVPYSMASRRTRGESPLRTWLHIIWRALLLIALGIFLSSTSSSRTNFTFVNVLTQIGLGYVFLCMLAGRGRSVQFATIGALLVGYWLLFFLWPLPPADFNHANVIPRNETWQGLEGTWAHWDKNTNAAAELDHWFLNLFPSADSGAALARNTANACTVVLLQRQPLAAAASTSYFLMPHHHFEFNAGGYQTLNFVPSLATMILGLMAGELLRSRRQAAVKLLYLILAAVACLGLGYLAGITVCPLVKRIWTPSWAIYCAGWTFAMLAAFYGIIDVLGWRRWAWPLVVVGMNSIAMYVMIQLMGGWVGTTWQTHLPAAWFNNPYGPIVRSGLIAVTLWLVCVWMYRRGLFLRI
jgi:predicted acyltransferase